ncbi:hypothetical protein ACFY1V_19970 [Streptomyces sp. NPDC001255]|uniref:hypothetical protein n=1 Tax=Streptomyces sp. NPDC001255 TaxID=3364550 RepID=UPI003695052A
MRSLPVRWVAWRRSRVHTSRSVCARPLLKDALAFGGGEGGLLLVVPGGEACSVRAGGYG